MELVGARGSCPICPMVNPALKLSRPLSAYSSMPVLPYPLLRWHRLAETANQELNLEHRIFYQLRIIQIVRGGFLKGLGAFNYKYTSWAARRCPGLYNVKNYVYAPRPPPPGAPPKFVTPPRPAPGRPRPTCKVSALYLENCANASRQTDRDRDRERQRQTILFIDIDELRFFVIFRDNNSLHI